MFKAKLIEGKNSYYRLKSKQLLFRMLPGFFAGVLGAILMNFSMEYLWWIIAGVGFYAVAIFVLYDNQKLMNMMVGEQYIEVDGSEILIKSKKGKFVETIKLEDAEKILVNERFEVSQEDLSGIINEVRGKGKKNYLIVHHNGEERRFDFEFNSHYMAVQMNKAIKQWTQKGYRVVREDVEDEGSFSMLKENFSLN